MPFQEEVNNPSCSEHDAEIKATDEKEDSTNGSHHEGAVVGVASGSDHEKNEANSDDEIDGGSYDSENDSMQFKRNHRLRRWHVTFGNPALGTYGGNIVTIHRRSRRRRRLLDDDDSDSETSSSEEEDESSCDSFSSCSSLESLLKMGDFEVDRQAPTQQQIKDEKSKRRMKRIAVMTNVKPDHVFDGVLNLVRGHRPFIERVRIVIGSSPKEEAEQRLLRWKRRKEKLEKSRNERVGDSRNKMRQRSQTWAGVNEEVDSNKFETEGTSTADVPPIDDNSDLPSQALTRNVRSSSMDALTLLGSEEQKFDTYEENAEFQESEHLDCEEESKNYHLLFVLDSEESTNNFVHLHGRPYTSLDPTDTCSVYHAMYVEGEEGVSMLGPFSSPHHQSSSSQSDGEEPSQNNCLHTMDEHQCPVCLEKMSLPSPSSQATIASSSILTTVCNHTFHIDCLLKCQDSPCPVCRYDHSCLNNTLSRCHVCSSTARNYVCLICGVVSCATGPSTVLPMSPSVGDTSDQTTSAQVPSHKGHALQHYEDTLHAYALDTETQHVWDFAGQGYVHRLLQNVEDGKIVEGRDPRALLDDEKRMNHSDGGETNLSAMERSAVPTYSTSAEDDEAVHRKLEECAGQYYTLLKSQLEQQRIYYEGRLEAIRREHEQENRNAAGRGNQSTSELISALKQERHQLEQRRTTLRRKHKKLSDDASFLKNMNESLETDKHVFRKQIAEAQADLAEAKEMNQQCLTPLEEKVGQLMLQLESEFVEDDPPKKNKKPAAKKR